MTESPPAYGLWGLALANSVVFLTFAFSFTHPHTERDWRILGGFSVFIVASFAEMYGFPLTLHVLILLGGGSPTVDPLSHDAGHLWSTLLGLSGDPSMGILHEGSLIAVVLGFALLASAWAALNAADSIDAPATAGPYAYVRHPQYVALMLVMLGLLLRGPTLLAVAMFPVLVFLYVRLAKDEEHWTAIAYGGAYTGYLAATPRWFPRLRRIVKSDRSQQ